MIYADISNGLPELVDGESYTLTGEYHGVFNIDKSVKIYGDALFTADSGKAIRTAADDIEIHGLRVETQGAHCIQAVDGKNLKINNVNLKTDGYVKDGLNFQASYPLTVTNSTISKGRSGLQLQTDKPGGDLIIDGNHISDTMDADMGCSVFIGTINNNLITVFKNAYIKNNYLSAFGENGIDLCSAVNVIVTGNTIFDGAWGMFLGRSQRRGGYNNKVFRNTFIRNKYAVHTRGGYDCIVNDNKIINCENGFWIDAFNTFNNNTLIETPVEYRVNNKCKINRALVQ